MVCAMVPATCVPWPWSSAASASSSTKFQPPSHRVPDEIGAAREWALVEAGDAGVDDGDGDATGRRSTPTRSRRRRASGATACWRRAGRPGRRWRGRAPSARRAPPAHPSRGRRGWRPRARGRRRPPRGGRASCSSALLARIAMPSRVSRSATSASVVSSRMSTAISPAISEGAAVSSPKVGRPDIQPVGESSATWAAAGTRGGSACARDGPMASASPTTTLNPMRATRRDRMTLYLTSPGTRARVRTGRGAAREPDTPQRTP